jgi:hypothetical protein
MASGLVWYIISDADVKVLAQIGAGRRVRTLPVAAGEEYAAMVVRSPLPDRPGNQSWADLLVFVDGTQSFFVRDVQLGSIANEPGTFTTNRRLTTVGTANT